MRKSFVSCPFFRYREGGGDREPVRQCGDGQFLVGGRFPDYCAKGQRSCPVAQFIRKMQQRGEPFYLWLRVGGGEFPAPDIDGADAPAIAPISIDGLSIDSLTLEEIGID